MFVYYQEKSSGDYLCIDTATRRVSRLNIVPDEFYDGRATRIPKNINTVTTNTISKAYLKAFCKRVAKKSMPSIWQQLLW